MGSSAKQAGTRTQAARRGALASALLIGAGLSLAVSCGDDDAAGRETPASGGSGGGGPDASGTGGSGGSVASGGASGGSGGATSPADALLPTIECNGKRCEFPALDNGLDIENCCWNDRYCGIRIRGTSVVDEEGCFPFDVPGTLNPDCPGVEVELNAVQKYGCCLEDGTCGAFGTPEGIASAGCLDPAVLKQPPGPPCDARQTCAEDGAACKVDRDCCPLPRGTLCATFGDSPGKCTDRCYGDGGCSSGCCRYLPDLGVGACAPAELCNDACGTKDVVCLLEQDCCDGFVCAPQFGGLRLCSPRCDTAPCTGTDVCVVTDDADAAKICVHAATVVCSDSCATANDGTCDDGGTTATGHACAYGADCSDCGPRAGGLDTCRETCRTADDGTCDDGGPSSKNSTCPLGSDCKDCGSRREVCTEVCAGHENGVCEDGGARSTASACALGTDCIDCRRRQTLVSTD